MSTSSGFLNLSYNTRRYIALFSLSLGSAASYTLPYIKFYFYNAWIAGLGLTDNANESAGFLLTLHMIGCILLYIPGGFIADKFSSRKIISFSLVGTGLLNAWYAYDPSYESARYIWSLLSVTVGFAYWSALIRAIRMLGTNEEQGKMYGWFNSVDGAAASIILGVATAVSGLTLIPTEQLEYIVLVQGSFCLLAAVATWIFFDDKLASVGIDETDKFKFSDLKEVLTNKWVWCVSIIILCTYGAYTGQSYLTPYMTDVIKLSPAAAAFLAIIRTKGARFVGGPVGGILADRIGSPAKVIIASNTIMITLLVMFFVLPQASESVVLNIVLSLSIAVVNFAGYNIMFSTMEEAHIPRYLTGTAAGIVSMVGYTPDGFINTIFGHWLDEYQNAGYDYIFLTLICMSVIGSVFCYIVMKHNQRVIASKNSSSS